MTDAVCSALIEAAGTIAAAGIAACVAVRTVGAELRKNREARKHEQQRDREARHHELRRSTYGGLIENAVRQGITVFAGAAALTGDQVEPLVRSLRVLMEAHLVASKETIMALMAAGRMTMTQLPADSFSRPVLVGLDRFASWTEGQIDLLLEARADLGFDRAEIKPLREEWLALVKWQRQWTQKQLGVLDEAPPTAAPSTTPHGDDRAAEEKR